MRASFLALAAAVSVRAVGQNLSQTSDPPTIGAFIDKQGITRIYGDSFGRPGYNDTYDYIVSCL